MGTALCCPLFFYKGELILPPRTKTENKQKNPEVDVIKATASTPTKITADSNPRHSEPQSDALTN